jgi:hypothetical protein
MAAIARLVLVPQTLNVVVGEKELSLDAAIDRAAEIQAEERSLKKEKDPLRDEIEAAIERAGLETYTTPSGHSATLFSQLREGCDKEYLKTVLTPEQYARAFEKKAVNGMKVS